MSQREYFAYGSNMAISQMEARCPTASVMTPGFLDGYRFRINRRGVATVVLEDHALVQGIVWLISEGDEETLDSYEGVASGLCAKAELPVRLADGRSTSALVYVAADSVSGQPRPGYLEPIIEAALSRGFSSAYVQELRRWLTTDG
jgi:gamma-glutamylcyclotransferase (GGCT)/AIG2-like uncharacterized protein YtfP